MIEADSLTIALHLSQARVVTLRELPALKELMSCKLVLPVKGGFVQVKAGVLCNEMRKENV